MQKQLCYLLLSFLLLSGLEIKAELRQQLPATVPNTVFAKLTASQYQLLQAAGRPNDLTALFRGAVRAYWVNAETSGIPEFDNWTVIEYPFRFDGHWPTQEQRRGFVEAKRLELRQVADTVEEVPLVEPAELPEPAAQTANPIPQLFPAASLQSAASVAAGPDDPYFPIDQPWLSSLNMRGLWAAVSGYAKMNLILLDIDSGVLDFHRDLRGELDSQLSRSFTADPSLASQSFIHGTQIAAIAAGLWNHWGMAGVIDTSLAPAHLVSFKIYDSYVNSTTLLEVVRSYRQILKLPGIVVVGNSYVFKQDEDNDSVGTGTAGVARLQIARDAISALRHKAFFVCAAGNDTGKLGPRYPASFALEPEMDNVISVSSLDADGNYASFSNTAQLYAAGESLLTVSQSFNNGTPVIPDTTFTFGATGTSFSQPQVLGISHELLRAAERSGAIDLTRELQSFAPLKQALVAGGRLQFPPQAPATNAPNSPTTSYYPASYLHADGSGSWRYLQEHLAELRNLPPSNTDPGCRIPPGPHWCGGLFCLSDL